MSIKFGKLFRYYRLSVEEKQILKTIEDEKKLLDKYLKEMEELQRLNPDSDKYDEICKKITNQLQDIENLEFELLEKQIEQDEFEEKRQISNNKNDINHETNNKNGKSSSSSPIRESSTKLEMYPNQTNTKILIEKPQTNGNITYSQHDGDYDNSSFQPTNNGFIKQQNNPNNVNIITSPSSYKGDNSMISSSYQNKLIHHDISDFQGQNIIQSPNNNVTMFQSNNGNFMPITNNNIPNIMYSNPPIRAVSNQMTKESEQMSRSMSYNQYSITQPDVVPNPNNISPNWGIYENYNHFMEQNQYNTKVMEQHQHHHHPPQQQKQQQPVQYRLSNNHTNRPKSDAINSPLSSPTKSHDTSINSNSVSPSQSHNLQTGFYRNQFQSASVKTRNSLGKEKPSTIRPLTKYLPNPNDPQFDLRLHCESNGHILSVLEPLVTLTTYSCYGTLYKMSTSFKMKTWKKKSFIFDRNRRIFAYYISPNSRKLKGQISFDQIIDVYSISNSTNDTNQNNNYYNNNSSSNNNHGYQYQFAIRILDPWRENLKQSTFPDELKLCAPSLEVKRVWLDVLFTGANAYLKTIDPTRQKLQISYTKHTT